MISVTETFRKTILNKAKIPEGSFTANPYTGCMHNCIYCYAKYMREWSGHSEPWGQFLEVKLWKKPTITEMKKKYTGAMVQIGTVTDPYQPYEAQFERTRALLRDLMVVPDCKLVITTKSSMVARDLDRLKKFKDPLVNFSICTMDEQLKQSLEFSDSIQNRIECMKLLHEEGIRVGCFLAPVLPNITNIPEIVEAVRKYCDFIMIERLQLRGEEKQDFFRWLNLNFKELLPLYNRIYWSKDLSYWKMVRDFYRDQFTNLGYIFTDDDSMEGRAPEPGRPIIINWLYRESMDDPTIRYTTPAIPSVPKVSKSKIKTNDPRINYEKAD